MEDAKVPWKELEAADAVAMAANQHAREAAASAADAAAAFMSDEPVPFNRSYKSKEVCDFLRELFPLPPSKAQAPPLDPTWLTWNDGIVVTLAQGIYEKGAFDRLPILADVLEEAGCTDAAILNHCRSGGEHVRGCGALDAVLGKT